jgi:hypothetical protein
MKASIAILIVLTCLAAGLYYAAVADDDDEHGHGHGRRRRGEGEHRVSAVDNPTYKEQCGACHFVYQPELLPSASWRDILSHLDNHHDNEVVIEPKDKETIAEYLETNAADHSSTRQAARIMQSLGSQVLTSITDVPYIRHKHRKIPPEVFERKSVGSRSNCAACHTTAEQGIYNDDNVRIPE